MTEKTYMIWFNSDKWWEVSYNQDSNKYLFSILLLYKYFSEKVKILESNLEKNLATVLGQIKLIDPFDWHN